MIHIIASQHANTTFAAFMEWEQQQSRFMVDTETTFEQQWCKRELLLVQFGNEHDEWLLEWPYLTEQQRNEVRGIMADHRLKVLHNAYFDCIVLRFQRVVLRNVYCTMVAEVNLHAGKLVSSDNDDEEDAESAEYGFYSLAAVLQRRLNLSISKEEQTRFVKGTLTPSQIEYAATDVRHLFKIMRQQQLELHQHDLEFTTALDCSSIPGLAEMTYNGMPLDTEAWRANIDLAYPVLQHATAQLEIRVKEDPKLLAKATEMGRYSEQDKVTINPKSPKQMNELFAHVYPEVGGSGKGVVRGFMKRNQIPEPERALALQHYEAGDFSVLEQYLLKHHRQLLIEHDWMVPAGSVTYNWNSQQQVLELFKAVDKRLSSLNKEAMAKFAHPIGLDLKEFKDALKLISTYGESFIEQYLEPDGYVRTTFNVAVSTGRLSSRKPNMQNIPAKEAVGNRYRNAFVAEPGWCYVDSDYASQELVVIAYISGDPVWMDALEKGKDLHSVCAEVVHKEVWKRAQEEGCTYYTKGQKKCNCKLHKRLRSGIKTINFGLAYGMSKYKLSATMGNSVQEADKLILEYFTRFPKIKRALNFLGHFGVRRGYIQTLAPFYRKRWFPYWKFARKNIEDHLKGVQYDSTLGSIERASKNMPIQGTSADMTKVAIWMIFEYIHQHDLSHKVKLVMQVHDQVTTRVRKDFAEQWKEIMHELMLAAAKFSIPNGLLGADTNITDVWTK